MKNLVRVISQDGSVMATVLDSTDLVTKMERTHKTSAVVTAALGRLCTAAAMMGAQLKGEKMSVTLRVNGKGPIGTLLAVADFNGDVKGTVTNTIVDIPSNDYGKLDVGGAVGTDGFLDVIRDSGYGEPYIGRVELASGEIGEDITYYYATSEQIPTVCGLGVLVNPDLSVNAAGGFLVQLLPYADSSVISVVEKNLEKINSISAIFSEKTPQQVADLLLEGLLPEILDESQAEYRCNCSKQRIEKALCSIGEKDLLEMAKDNKTTLIECHFCDKKYTFSSEQLVELAAGIVKE